MTETSAGVGARGLSSAEPQACVRSPRCDGAPARESPDVRSVAGLSEAEAASRLGRYGYNELPTSRKRGVFALAAELLREPMLLLLIATSAVYLLLGDHGEALLLAGSIVVVVGIALYQERKTERALEALRDLSSPRALAVRDGVRRRIPGREVVPGDVLVLAEGDRVPADGVLVWHTNLSVDESLLTGESVPVRKAAWDGSREWDRPGGDDLPFVYSGTLVVQGRGLAKVHTTSVHTELGKIGRALQTMVPEATLLQSETRRLVRILAAMGAALCAAVVIVYGLTRGDWLGGFLAGLTLAMALVPEEFPVVLTIFLALGAWRLAQKHVLTRRAPAVETLGSATVLCVDKTGTLTLNQMTVARLFAGGALLDVTGASLGPPSAVAEALVASAVLASPADSYDPMERALRRLGERLLAPSGAVPDGWSLAREYPLTRDLLAMSRAWQVGPAQGYVVVAKGAPEAIAELCRFTPEQRLALSRHLGEMADGGLRVLGVARAHTGPGNLPDDLRDFDFSFLGLIGLADPVRSAAPAAIAECYGAGIRVVMITGDYPGTACAVARQIGLAAPDQVLTGVEVERMDDATLREHVRTVNVFARVVPEQKLRLVNALKANGEVVAMTGDGVNDAPALKAAHIGIAMGERGTDVAREAAALVLLDDDFSSIVRAVRMGRRIFDNLKKAMIFLLGVHVPIAGLSLAPVLFGWPLILLPVHIVFLELLIDPACSIVFEAELEEAGVMRRPPRRLDEPLFSLPVVGWSAVQGASVLLVVLSTYAASLWLGQGDLWARALTFTMLIIANLGLILTNRSSTRTIWSTLRAPNVALWAVIGSAAALLGLVLYVPFLRTLFHFQVLHPDDLAIVFAGGTAIILWFEVLKLLRRAATHSPR